MSLLRGIMALSGHPKKNVLLLTNVDYADKVGKSEFLTGVFNGPNQGKPAKAVNNPHIGYGAFAYRLCPWHNENVCMPY